MTFLLSWCVDVTVTVFSNKAAWSSRTEKTQCLYFLWRVCSAFSTMLLLLFHANNWIIVLLFECLAIITMFKTSLVCFLISNVCLNWISFILNVTVSTLVSVINTVQQMQHKYIYSYARVGRCRSVQIVCLFYD